MRIYYINTNAYKMLIADNGDTRFVITEDRFDFAAPQTEEEAAAFLTDNAENLAYNATEWEAYDETVEELTENCEILAEIEA